MALPTFHTFTITVADPEEGRTENVRDHIKETLENNGDLIVLDIDCGTGLILKSLIQEPVNGLK